MLHKPYSKPGTTALAARLAERFGPRVLFGGAALFLLAVPFCLLLLLVEASWSPLVATDSGVRDALHGFAVPRPGFVLAMKGLSLIGAAQVTLSGFAVLACWLLLRRRVRLALFTLATTFGSVLVNEAVKGAVHRARPVLPQPVDSAGGYSFPSGHAQAAVVTYVVLGIVLLPSLVGWLRRCAVGAGALMIVGIGFSRVALGVHFVSDVLAGYVVGAAWVAIMAAAFDLWAVRHRTPQR